MGYELSDEWFMSSGILNMVFEQAIEDGLIQRNPLHSRSIRITGQASKPIVP